MNNYNNKINNNELGQTQKALNEAKLKKRNYTNNIFNQDINKVNDENDSKEKIKGNSLTKKAGNKIAREASQKVSSNKTVQRVVEKYAGEAIGVFLDKYKYTILGIGGALAFLILIIIGIATALTGDTLTSDSKSKEVASYVDNGKFEVEEEYYTLYEYLQEEGYCENLSEEECKETNMYKYYETLKEEINEYDGSYEETEEDSEESEGSSTVSVYTEELLYAFYYDREDELEYPNEMGEEEFNSHLENNKNELGFLLDSSTSSGEYSFDSLIDALFGDNGFFSIFRPNNDYVKDDYEKEYKDYLESNYTTAQIMTGGYTLSQSSFKNSIINFYQYDYDGYYYSNSPLKKGLYPSTRNHSLNGYASIGTHGCGPSSLAIVLSSFSNKATSLVSMTEEVCSSGYCTGSGTYPAAMCAITRKYGLNCSEYSINSNFNVGTLKEALENPNKLVIVLAHTGHFTSGGHFFVLTGVDSNNKVTISDPGSKLRTSKTYELSFLLDPTLGNVDNIYIIGG